MKQAYFSYRAFVRVTAISAFLATTVGCKDGAEPLNSLRHANVRSELKDNLKSAFDNLAREAKVAGSLKGIVENIQRLLKVDLGESVGLPDLDALNPEFLGTVVDKVLESDLARALFAETNIASRTENEVVYIVESSICDKFAGLTSTKSSDERAIATCKRFLEKNALELHVKTQDEKGLELEVWHGAVAAGAAPKKFVTSLVALPNSIGSRLNLDGAKDFAKAIFALQPQDSSAANAISVMNLAVGELQTLKGTVSLWARFKSDKAASGCQNGERLCIVVNVDEDIQAALSGEEQLEFSFTHSSKEKPTVTIAANADNGFTGTFNLGVLEGKTNDVRLFVEASQFKVTFPELKNESAIQFTIENFKPGPRASTFEGGGKKIVVDLTNEARVIESFHFLMDSKKMLAKMSPFALFVQFSDESDDTCKSYESLQFANNAHDVTTVQFLSAQDLASNFASRKIMKPTKNRHFFFRSNDNDEPLCTADNLMVRRMLMSINVSSDHCNEPGMVAITSGSLALKYDYHVNKEDEQNISVSVSTGQCLVP